MLSFKSNRIKLNVKYWLAQLTALLWTENKANYYQTNVRLLLVEEMNLLSTISIVIGWRHVLPPISTPKTETRGKQKPSSWSPFSPHPRHHGQCSRRRPTPATTAGDFLRRPASIQVFFFFFFSLIDAAFSPLVNFCWWWASLNCC